LASALLTLALSRKTAAQTTNEAPNPPDQSNSEEKICKTKCFLESQTHQTQSSPTIRSIATQEIRIDRGL
jgi:hypothetical protein